MSLHVLEKDTPEALSKIMFSLSLCQAVCNLYSILIDIIQALDECW